ncbi:MAG: aminodeoxychorismate/anthranilate synthase component II [Candidatus Melainabacteria bacterium]|jgi:anthranilate synthase/aminodeoxychorismate synthase-like glutamine amidotransferase|nr:aminodeoxychorismate/anthranilate synthase component II [Candidatus Melainabacteria bacterium]
MRAIIIDNYDSFTFNLYQMLVPLVRKLEKSESADVEVFRNDAVSLDEIVAMKPTHIVLSPGPGHPSVERDFGVCKDVILSQKKLGAALMGVCLGHQGIVAHLGGEVVRAQEIVHGKTSQINVETPSRIFEGIGGKFEAMRYHSLVAKEESFPADLRITAREGKHGLIMALEHKSEPIYGVQFHPESIGTAKGSLIMENFLSV